MPSTTKESRIVEMKFRNKDFEKNAKQSIKTLDELEEKLRFEGVEEGVKRIDSALSQIDLGKLDKALDTINYRLSTTGIAAAKVIGNLIDGISSKLEGLFNIIQTKGEARARNIENATFSMKSLFGETKEGLKMVEDMMGPGGPVRNSVSGTRFGLDEAAGAAAMFAAAGIDAGEKMEGVLKSVAGVATVTNRSFSDISDVLADMATKGSLSGDTISRLAERNFNLTKDLQEALGKTAEEIQAMARKHEISADTVFEVLQKYADASKKANDTYDGAYENLKAALGRMSVDIETNWRETKRKVFVDLIRMIDNFTYSLNKGINSFNEFISMLGELVQKLLQNDKLIASIMLAFASLDAVVRSVVSLFGDLKEAVVEWYPVDLVEWINRIAAVFYLLTGSLLKIIEENQSKIQGFFSIILGPLQAIGATVLFVGGIIIRIAGAIKSAIMGVVSGFKAAGQMLDQTGFLSAMATLFKSIWDGLAPARELIMSFFSFLATKIKELLPSTEQLTDFFTKLSGKIVEFATYSGGKLQYLGDKLKSFFGLFKEFKMPKIDSSKARDSIVGFADAVKGALLGLRDAIREVFGMGKVHAAGSHSSISQVAEATNPVSDALERFKKGIEQLKPYLEDFGKIAEKVTPVIITFMKLFIANKFASGFKNAADGVAKVGTSMAGMFDKIGGSFGALTERISNFGKETKSDIFKKIATSILMLAAAFFLIAQLEWADIAKGAAVMTGFFVAMGVMMAIAKKWKVTEAGSFKMVGKGMMEIAAAMLIMSLAMRSIAKINDKKFVQALVGFVVMVGMVAGLLAVIGQEFKSGNFDGASIVAAGFSILLIANAMLVMAGALAILSLLDPDDLLHGVMAICAMIITLGAALALVGRGANSPSYRQLLATGAAILMIAGALAILTPCVMALAIVPWPLIVKGLGTLGLALLGLSTALFLVSKFGGKGEFIGVGAGILLMALALQALVIPIITLGSIDINVVGRGIIFLAAMLTALSVAIGLLGRLTYGGEALRASAGILLVALALNMLVIPITTLGALPWDVVLRGIVFLSAMLAAISLALGLLAANTSGLDLMTTAASIASMAASMWLLAKAVGAVAGILAVLTLLDTKKLRDAGIGLGLIMAAMAALLYVGAAVPGLSIGILAVGAAFALFGVAALAVAKSIEVLIDVFERIADMDPAKIFNFVAKAHLMLIGLQALVPEFIKLVDLVFDGIIHIIVRKSTMMAEAGLKIITEFLRILDENIDSIIAYGALFIIKLLVGIDQYLPLIILAGTKLILDFIAGLNASSQLIIDAGTDLIVNIINGMNDSVDKIQEAANNFVENLSDGIVSEENLRKLGEVGGQAVAGILKGVGDGIKDIKAAGAYIGECLVSGTASEKGIDSNSPSKKMIKLGNYAADGLRLGVVQYDRIIANTGAKLGKSLLSGVEKVAGYNKGRKFTKYLGSVNKAVKEFINSQKITDASGMGNHLYLKSDEYKENVRQLKDYYKEYNETYKKSQIDLAKSKALSGEQAEKAHEEYEKDIEDLKEIEKNIVKMGKTIAKGPAKALESWRKELKKTIKEFLSLKNMDLNSKNINPFSNVKTTSNLSNANNLLQGLTGSLMQFTEAAKSSSDQFNILSTSYSTGMNLLERFGKVSTITTRRLMVNAQSQIKAYEEFQNGLAKMKEMGFEQSLIDEMAAKGPEALSYIRGFIKMDATQRDTYNSYIKKQREYEEQQFKKNMEDNKKQYEDYMQMIEELAARGLHEGIIRRLKEGGVEQYDFVRLLTGMDNGTLSTVSDYYEDSVAAMNELQKETSTATDTFKSFGDMLDAKLFKNNIWNLMLYQLDQKGVDETIIKYFRDAGYDSAHEMVDSILKETPRGIEEINKKWKQYSESEGKISGVNWAIQMEDSNKVVKDYTSNMETLASMLPNGRQNPIYQKVSELGVEDGNEYAKAFIEADSATRARIQKAFKDEQKANADLMMSELKDRLAKTQQWADNLNKIASMTYQKNGAGHKKGDHIISADLYNELVALGPEASDLIQDLAGMTRKQLAEFAKENDVNIKGVVTSSEKTVTEGYKDVAKTAVKSFKNYMKKPETVDEIKEAVNKALADAAKENKKQAKKDGQAVGSAGASGFSSKVSKAGTDGARDMLNGWTKTLDEQIKNGDWSNPVKTITDMVKNVMHDGLENGSPSRFTMRQAKWFAIGFDRGIRDNESTFTGSVIDMAENVKDAFEAVNEGIQNDLYNRQLDYKIDITPIDGQLNLGASIAQASQIADIFSSISGVNFEIGRDANTDVVNAINDMRGDFQNQFDSLSQTISEMQLVMDSGALVGQIANPMNEALGERIALAQRGVLA